jgi:hypothetical protein
MDERTASVAAVLRETARAHHQAFLASDGEDPEWPSWYADRLQASLAAAGIDLTRSVIVYLLVACEREFPDAGRDWPERYAERFVSEAG